MWHPKNLTWFYQLKFCQEIKLFHLSRFTFWYYGFLPQVETFQKYYWILYALSMKQFLFSGFNCKICLSLSIILLKWFFMKLESLLHCNHLANAFKIFTKIWGCHVMFPHHFYAKTSFGYWRFWALHQLFKSGPVGIFALQPI